MYSNIAFHETFIYSYCPKFLKLANYRPSVSLRSYSRGKYYSPLLVNLKTNNPLRPSFLSRRCTRRTRSSQRRQECRLIGNIYWNPSFRSQQLNCFYDPVSAIPAFRLHNRQMRRKDLRPPQNMHVINVFTLHEPRPHT